jgi:hypothetical protein
MPATVEPISRDAVQRERMVRFLAAFEDENRGEAFWESRLRHWWDANPFCDADSPRGFVLRDGDAVVGFFGLIPQQYVCDGRTYPTLALTTWRVDANYRAAAAGMFVRVRRLGARFLLTDCTPTAEVREILERAGFERRAAATRVYLPLKRAHSLKAAAFATARLWRGTRLPLDGASVVTLDDEWIAADFVPLDRPRKRITRDSLAWLMISGLEKWFRGLRDRDGKLIAYVIAIRSRMAGVPSLDIVEYGSATEDGAALCALLEALAANPGGHGVPNDVGLFSLTSLEAEPWLRRFPLRKRATRAIAHYYCVPPGFPAAQKYAQLLEGDFGL